MKTRLYIVEMFQKRTEKTTPFGTSITRSEVLYWAAQGLRGVNVVFRCLSLLFPRALYTVLTIKNIGKTSPTVFLTFRQAAHNDTNNRMLYVRSAGSSESTLLHCGKQLQQTLRIQVDMLLSLVDMLLTHYTCLHILVGVETHQCSTVGRIHALTDGQTGTLTGRPGKRSR